FDVELRAAHGQHRAGRFYYARLAAGDLVEHGANLPAIDRQQHARRSFGELHLRGGEDLKLGAVLLGGDERVGEPAGGDSGAALRVRARRDVQLLRSRVESNGALDLIEAVVDRLAERGDG